LVDTSTTGARLLRYEAAAEMSLHRNVNLLIRLRKAEPEHQTLSRWDKEGIKHGRIWDGSGWRYCEPEDMKPVAEPNLEALAALGRHGSESSANVALEEPGMDEGAGTFRADLAVDSGAERSEGTTPAVARSVLQKEANFSDKDSHQQTTCVDSKPGSPAASEAIVTSAHSGGDHWEIGSPLSSDGAGTRAELEWRAPGSSGGASMFPGSRSVVPLPRLPALSQRSSASSLSDGWFSCEPKP
jgi:hypothetical protein